jgi:ribosomal RNA-processing protein 36
MQEVKREERDKVADGKGAFFLKRSAKKAIAVEERFNELKRDGKLQKFMAKKRQKNANKDYHKMPSRRGGDEDDY